MYMYQTTLYGEILQQPCKISQTCYLSLKLCCIESQVRRGSDNYSEILKSGQLAASNDSMEVTLASEQADLFHTGHIQSTFDIRNGESSVLSGWQDVAAAEDLMYGTQQLVLEVVPPFISPHDDSYER